jgi:tRNA (guanine37-N1)-methyltransferase
MYSFHVLTLFPRMVTSPLEESILGKAQAAGLIGVTTHDIRAFTDDKHRTADDVPFGGGSGMVMKPEPLVRCIEDVRAAHAPDRIYLLSPSGRPFDQQMAQELAGLSSVGLVCGRYEGVDDRVTTFLDGEISIGDFVLTGGELGALVVIDAVARLLPGVLGNESSPLNESHAGEPLLEHPHYTRPRSFRGVDVPEVLLSGNHAAIARWRRQQSLVRTRNRRPDLFARLELDAADRRLLDEAKDADDASESAKNPLSPAAKPAIYLALLHHPVYNKRRETVATAVTNVDIHDIARSSRTYGLSGFYLVTPVEQQRALVAEILGHWTEGAGARHNPRRADALSRAEVVPALADVIEAITHREGKRPDVVVTGARLAGAVTSYQTLRARMTAPDASQAPVLIVLGTGWGLTSEVVDAADIRLAPIDGVDGYNHLSVRSAAAIILDRLLGEREDSDAGSRPAERRGFR